MSRIRTSDTDIEKVVSSGLHARGLRFRKHVRILPGSPDIVFAAAMVAVFIDGDFWHGYRFPVWKHKLSLFWQEKIDKNRSRDQRNFATLRRRGWIVIRLWKHEVKSDAARCVARVERAVRLRKAERSAGHRKPGRPRLA